MAPLTLIVELVPSVGHTDKRAVAILRGHGNLTAGPEYDAIAESSVGKRVKYKMGLWIAFVPDTAGKFHRFKNIDEKYKDCIVFIDLEAQLRLYGFTCHPTPNTAERFELVVLTEYDNKKENRTDVAVLNRILMWKDHMATKEALLRTYPDKKDEKKS
ncbi:MAG: hypothetical protein ABSA29_17135 [Terriglobales bacterium]|jgi:hypothetical protein